MTFPRLRAALPAVALGTVAILTACSASDTTQAAGPDTGSATLSIVASTNVWASVAEAVGGDTVTVTSVLDDPSADPHSFEASPKVKLAMSSAALVIVNGGGYDDWASSTAASISPAPNVLDATETSGMDSTPADFNEHVFYDFDAVAKVATAISTELGTAQPASAKTFSDNAAAFTAQLTELEGETAALGAQHPGTSVISTEPVPGYLIRALGFTDVTPAGFSAAVEAESEVSVKDLNDTEKLLTGGTVKLLFDNTQTGGRVVDQLLATAGTAGVGVVGVTETLPAGVPDYLTWMRKNLAEITTALG